MNIVDKIKNIQELRKQLQTAETEFQYNSIFEFRSTCFAHGVPFENTGNSLIGNNVIFHSNEKGHIIAKNMIKNGYTNMRTYFSRSYGELPYLVSFGFLPQLSE